MAAKKKKSASSKSALRQHTQGLKKILMEAPKPKGKVVYGTIKKKKSK